MTKRTKSNSIDSVGPLEQQEQDKNNKQRTKNDPKNQAPNSEGKKIATSTAKESPSHVKNLVSILFYSF